MHIDPTWLLSPLCLLALIGCGRRDRDPDPQPDPLETIGLEQALAVFAARDGDAPPAPREVTAAEKAVAEAVGDEWRADDEPLWTTMELLPHRLGLVACQRHVEQSYALRLALLERQGDCLWRKQLELGSNFRLETAETVEVSGLVHPVLALKLGNPNATADNVTRLFYAITADDALLIRVENADGDWAAAKLNTNHPNLTIDFGKLHAERVDLRLAALVALSQPAQRELRHDSKIRSTLESLAGSTDTVWLAEAAAQVLTLP